MSGFHFPCRQVVNGFCIEYFLDLLRGLKKLHQEGKYFEGESIGRDSSTQEDCFDVSLLGQAYAASLLSQMSIPFTSPPDKKSDLERLINTAEAFVNTFKS